MNVDILHLSDTSILEISLCLNQIECAFIVITEYLVSGPLLQAIFLALTRMVQKVGSMWKTFFHLSSLPYLMHFYCVLRFLLVYFQFCILMWSCFTCDDISFMTSGLCHHVTFLAELWWTLMWHVYTHYLNDHTDTGLFRTCILRILHKLSIFLTQTYTLKRNHYGSS